MRDREFRGRYAPVNAIHGEGISLTTNASGDATWTFPTAFPTDIFTVHITPCDIAIGGFVVKPYLKSSGNTDRTKVSFRSYDMAGAVIASFGIKVNITAFGY